MDTGSLEQLATNHHVDVVRTRHEAPEVPDTWHVTCACGWAAAVHDEAAARVLAGEHFASPALPEPASPTPDVLQR